MCGASHPRSERGRGPSLAGGARCPTLWPLRAAAATLMLAEFSTEHNTLITGSGPGRGRRDRDQGRHAATIGAVDEVDRLDLHVGPGVVPLLGVCDGGEVRI